MDNNELVICQGLTKNYGKKTALNNLNLTLGRGQFIGLLGPNGSGKTKMCIRDSLPTAFLQKRHNVLLGEAKLAHAGQKFRDALSRDLLSYLTNHFSVLRYIASARAVGEHQALALHFRKRALHGVRVDTRLSRQLAHRRYLFTRRKLSADDLLGQLFHKLLICLLYTSRCV